MNKEIYWEVVNNEKDCLCINDGAYDLTGRLW